MTGGEGRRGGGGGAADCDAQVVGRSEKKMRKILGGKSNMAQSLHFPPPRKKKRRGWVGGSWGDERTAKKKRK